jgi:hypothetical protein
MLSLWERASEWVPEYQVVAIPSKKKAERGTKKGAGEKAGGRKAKDNDNDGREKEAGVRRRGLDAVVVPVDGGRSRSVDGRWSGWLRGGGGACTDFDFPGGVTGNECSD